MEWVIWLTIVIAYSSLASRLDKIIDKHNFANKKKFPSLKKLLDKNVIIQANDELDTFENEVSGILRDFSDEWIVIESIDKKKRKVLYYYRLSKIVSIDVIEKSTY